MKNIYKPIEVKVSKITRQAEDVSLIRFKRVDGRDFARVMEVGGVKNKPALSFIPGQFIMAGLWGYGEAPFGVASNPYARKYMDIVVRGVGNVTNKLITLKKNETATLRGPFGWRIAARCLESPLGRVRCAVDLTSPWRQLPLGRYSSNAYIMLQVQFRLPNFPAPPVASD